MIRVRALLTIAAAVSFSGCFESSKTVKGRVMLADGLAAKLTPTSALYVIARPAGQMHGPPMAVRRFVQPLQFPLEFTLGPNDSMIPDLPLKGRVAVTARIARSGSAMPIQAGDIDGESSPSEVDVGQAQPVEISLHHEISAAN